ncbi:DUF5819 family protein [Glutamicibacter protophormiae]|uniref:DUF5819 family protein n=1 Tax=Glutamicibacter protophormiae TaxID=37930 RepID=UPI002A819A8A|nr:DUF5819 family protein [Glutamicibacter protophormiae]WPR63329.1 DUF5819 family protein [Glutamicibacter protophormiae]WPR66825.1 DUF5819 family protein [Glutamicibacter protophormiae]
MSQQTAGDVMKDNFPGEAENSAPPVDQELRKRSKLVLRLVTVTAVLFTAWHVFASFLWISPPSELRKVVPGNALSEYMLPMFGQSWSVFAPEPINGDNRMLVRAVVLEGGEERMTEWVNVTDVESQLISRKVFPARAGNQSIDLASAYRASYAKLTPEQQDLVNLNFFEGENWHVRVTESLYELSDNEPAIIDYINSEFRSVRYSTQVAKAMWGDNVLRVQFQMERQNVIPFAERNNPDAVRPPVQLTPTGWRGLQSATGQSEEDFANTFMRLYENLQP